MTGQNGHDELAAKHIEFAHLLAELGHAVRDHLVASRNVGTDSVPVASVAGDTIFAIDRKVEPIILSVVEGWPDELKPILIVAEGIGNDGRHHCGSTDVPLRYQLLIDPIDGTRGLMYDKRSAWFLATLAPDRGAATCLSDSIASAMIELPTSKQTLSDSLIATRGGTLLAWRTTIEGGERQPIAVKPSREKSLHFGFGQVSNFFPGTKVIAAELMEEIVSQTLGSVQPGQASVFDDQYISTGGQMVELIVGHDRFCCDLRPLFYDILERRLNNRVQRGLECHSYDAAGALVAEAAGVILTDGYGQKLDAPFSVNHPVHWCGYANEELRSHIEPIIQRWLVRNL